MLDKRIEPPSRGPVMPRSPKVFPPWYKKNLSMSPDIMPHPWASPEDLEFAYRRVNEIYDRLFPRLVRALNVIWKTNYSSREVKIITGTLFHTLLGLVYEKYCLIKFSAHPIELDGDFKNFVAKDSKSFFSQCQSDEFNDFLLWYISSYLANPSSPETDLSELKVYPFKSDSLNKKNRFFRKLLKFLFYFKSNDDVFIITPYLNYFDWALLELSFRQVPAFRFCWSLGVEGLPNEALRELLFELLEPSSVADELDRVLLKLTAYLMPMSIIEGFSQNLDDVKKKLSTNTPKLIIDANSFNSCDSFKIYSAQAVQDGAKLMIVQHGGYYGFGKFFASQDHELDICDIFFSSGWEMSGSEKVYPGCFVKRQSFLDRWIPVVKKRFNVLVVDTVNSRFAYHFFGAPVGSVNVLKSLDFRRRFLDEASLRWPGEIGYKPPPVAYGYDRSIFDSPPGVDLVAEGGFAFWARRSKVVVIFYNSTTLLEAIALRCPFVICFDFERDWLLSDKGRDVIAVCESVGIYARSPEAVLDTLASCASDVEAWWSDPARQEAVDLLDEFTCNRDDNVVERIHAAAIEVFRR